MHRSGRRQRWGRPRPTRPKKPGRDRSGRRPRPPEAAHKRAHIRKGRRICRPCRMKPLQCHFCWFRRWLAVGLGGRGAASAAVFGDSCPCNRERLLPRAREEAALAGASWPPAHNSHQPPGQPSTVTIKAAALATMDASPEARWTEVRLIGRGAQGSVHLVRHNSTSQLCVRKRVATENLSKRDRDAAHRECQLLKTLDHPRIVKFVESFEGRLEDDARCLHLVMEWCPQGDLAYHINEAKSTSTKFSEAQIAKWFAQMGDALAYLHSRRVLHRDLKSTNVFVDAEMNLKLGDLGIAKILESTLARASTVVGTPNYLSPELCENKPYGPASDVWALGCVLYELRALKRPFDASNLFGIVYSVVKGDADLDAVSTDEGNWLRLLVKRLLTKDAELRPTIAQVLKDTRGLQEHVLCQGPVVSPDQYDDDFEVYNGQPSVTPTHATTKKQTSPFSGGRYAGMPNARESPPLETRYLEPRRPAEVVIERLKTPLLEAPPPVPPSPVEPAKPPPPVRQPKPRRDVARPTAASAARATPSPALERRSGSPPTVPKVRRTATPSPPLASFSRKHTTPLSGARHKPRPRKQKAESPLAKFRARAHESFLGAGAKPPRAPPPPPSGQPLVTRARSEPALFAARKVDRPVVKAAPRHAATSVGTFDALVPPGGNLAASYDPPPPPGPPPPTPPPPLDPADRVENERTRQLRRRLGDAAYDRVYAICRRAHERCTAVRKRDLFEVVAQNDYDACLAVEQLVFADIVRSTASRQRAATLE